MDQNVKELLEAAGEALFTLDHTSPTKGEEFPGSLDRARQRLRAAIRRLTL